MERRSFLKSTCKICLLGAAGFAVAMEACSPKTGAAAAANTPGNTGNTKQPVIAKDNMAAVPLSMLTAEKQYQIITVEKYPFEIAIEQKEDKSYKALLLMCTHYDNALTPTGNGYTCSLHGSRFTKEGKVLNGPAEDPLKELKTEIKGNNLIIQLVKIS